MLLQMLSEWFVTIMQASLQHLIVLLSLMLNQTRPVK